MMGLRTQSLLAERYRLLPLVVLLLVFLLTGGCDKPDEKKKFSSPAGYDLNRPIEIKLPLELDEISGIVYYPKDTSVMAINDEHGWLYKVFLNHPQQIQKWKFSSGADFEDIALVDSVFYVLQSNGNMVVFKFLTGDSLYLRELEFPFGKGNEFETLYYDSSSNKLILICKDCVQDTKGITSAFAFDKDSFQYRSDVFKIQNDATIERAEQEKKLKPSAAAVNPVTGELYIISSVNEMLIVADRDGRAKQVYPLDHTIYKQPEGLCFTKNGTLIISNEAADVGVANILVIPYHQSNSYVR